MRIGVDIMGGDFFPQAPVEGAIRAKSKLGESTDLVLFGNEAVILEELGKQGASPADFVIVHCDQVIEMHESPTKAIAQKQQSSIALGIGMVKAGQLDGFVSAGNTGAMLVASIMVLGKIEGVNRPTIGALFPNSANTLTLLCDVGANVDVKSETLAQFGLLGSLYMESVMGMKSPRVALMNVGEEEGKGPDVIKAAYQLMADSPHLNFVGNAEGRDLYHGKADIYVCDGFTGNIVLKFGESLYDILSDKYPSDDFIQSFNFENYGGVPILGIKGISIIGHGISNGKAIENMIHSAVTARRSGLVDKISERFASFQTQNP